MNRHPGGEAHTRRLIELAELPAFSCLPVKVMGRRWPLMRPFTVGAVWSVSAVPS